MPTAQTDFALTIDRAAGLTVDAASAARAAGGGRLPPTQRRLLNSATSALIRAQDLLYQARHAPWHQQPKRRQQLELELAERL